MRSIFLSESLKDCCFEQDLDPRIENKDGDNPFHVAAKLDEPLVLEAMIRTFNTPGSKFNIDQQNGDGEFIVICHNVTKIS